MPEPPRSFGLLPRAGHTAWGWRLEIGLAVAGLVAVRLADRLGPGGEVLVLGLAGVVVWRWRGLRRFLGARLDQAAERRRIEGALRACSVIGPWGFPRVGRTVATAAGSRVLVRAPLGCHIGLFETAAPALAAALRVREVRIVKDPTDASVAALEILARDPFAGPPLAWPLAGAARTDLWRPVPLGVDETGNPVAVLLPEHNMLLGGEPGAGKSAALSLLVACAALDPEVTLTLFDAKQVELAPWRKSAEAFVGPDPARAIEVLERLRTEMDARYATLLAEGRRKVERADGLGLHLVAIDEMAYFLRSGARAQREAVTEGLRDLVSRGRAAGMVVVAATQKPSHDTVPTAIRDLFSYRFALRCTTTEASDTVLGQGWAAQGYSAATVDPAARGVGFLLAEGGVPVRLRTAYLDDETLRTLAKRAAQLRGAG